MRDWRDLAHAVLAAGEPREKCERAIYAFKNWRLYSSESSANLRPPPKPNRPARPSLLNASEMPKRSFGSVSGRQALLHSLAHIEFNAIDLAFDMALRFAPEISAIGLSADLFARDWISVGADEARHFRMLAVRLSDLGASYGDLPAHEGLWESAEETSDSVLARLAIVPLVLEARGLDVTPAISDRLRQCGDARSAAILDAIWRDETAHVAAGTRWFKDICQVKGLEPANEFGKLVRERFRGGLKPPFHQAARDAAGMPRAFYEGWNGNCAQEAIRSA